MEGTAGDAIFLLQGGRLEELANQAYASEDLLQRLLADHPRLMAGGQIDPESPRRWLLVTREMPVPGEEEGGRRWSLDHLFLDQGGVPTLVEVKRATDLRLRREVVGQMLDYAANAVVHWPVERIRSRFEEGENPAARLDELLGGEGDPELFWSQVKTNLQAGRVRLVFVADLIPPELRRVIEFLNAQMDPAEVLGLEIKQYGSDELTTLVPRVIGHTAVAQQRKAVSGERGQAWDEASFFATLAAHNDAAIVDVTQRIYDWARDNGVIGFGRGKQDASFGLTIPVGGRRKYLWQVWAKYGTMAVNFEYVRTGPPFDDEAKRRELLRRLNAIPGVDLPPDSFNRRRNFRLSAFIPPERLQAFLDVLAWARDEIRAAGERA